MKNKTQNIIKAVCLLATMGSAVAQTSEILIDNDFSSGTLSTNSRIRTNQSDGTFYTDNNPASDWAIAGGVLSNAGTSLTSQTEGALSQVINTSGFATDLTSLTLSFDYTVGATATLKFALVGYRDNLQEDGGTGDVLMNNGTANGSFQNNTQGELRQADINLLTGADMANSITEDLTFGSGESGSHSVTIDLTSYVWSADEAADASPANTPGFSGSITGIKDFDRVVLVVVNDLSSDVGVTATTLDNIMLTVESVAALPSATWDGETDANWSTNTNWLADLTPVSLDELVFTGIANAATNNDLTAGTKFNGISFPNTADAENFTLAGNSIILGGDITQSVASGSITDTISLDMELSGDRVVNSGKDHNLEVSGVISEDASARALTKSGDGTLTLSAANTYTGVTSVNAGRLTVANADALGSVAGNTVVADGATLLIEGGITITEPLNLIGRGVGNSGALRSDGNNTVSSAIILDSRGRIETVDNSGKLILTGGVTGSGNALVGNIQVDSLIDIGGVNINIWGSGASFDGPGFDIGNVIELNVAGNTWGNARLSFDANVRLGVSDAIVTTSTMTFGFTQADQSTAQLDLNGFDQTLASIAAHNQGVAGDVNITGGGTLTLDQATDSEYGGRITDGSTPTALVKTGIGALTLNNLSGTPSNYTGGTTVNDGTLIMKVADFDDSSTVTVSTNGVLQLDHSGVDTVGALVFGVTPQAPGIYNAANSSGNITGTGSLVVSSGDTFSSWAVTNGVSGGVTGDSDQDGHQNGIEYAFDTLIDGFQAVEMFSGNTLSATKRAEAVANGDVTYSIEVSSDLGVTDPWTAVTLGTNDATTVSYELPSGAGKIFARLHVAIAPE